MSQTRHFAWGLGNKKALTYYSKLINRTAASYNQIFLGGNFYKMTKNKFESIFRPSKARARTQCCTTSPTCSTRATSLSRRTTTWWWLSKIPVNLSTKLDSSAHPVAPSSTQRQSWIGTWNGTRFESILISEKFDRLKVELNMIYFLKIN